MTTKYESGRQRIINEASIHITNNRPDRVDDNRIWDVIEGIVSDYRQRRDTRSRWEHLTFGTAILKYWDKLTDPDGLAATRLIKAIRKEVQKRGNGIHTR